MNAKEKDKIKELDDTVIAARADADDAFKVVNEAAENSHWGDYDAALEIYSERNMYANAITDFRDAAYRNAISRKAINKNIVR